MKKTTLALAVAIASLTTAVNAAPPENSWYVGAKMGWSRFYSVEQDKIAGATDSSKDNLGGGAFVGYQANPYLAFELGYDYLGRVKYDDNMGKLTVQGASLTGKLSYPLAFITPDLDAYLRAGAFISATRWKGQDSKYKTGNDNDVAPLVAAGLDYRLTDSLSTRLEYQYINGLNNDGPTKPDNSMVSLGIVYNFGTPAAAPAPVVEQKTEFREQRYVLNEDVLFDYDKSTLKADGEKALDDLLGTLTKINPSEGTVIVLGHTDRIGSDSYNQKLSERRAKAVVDYLTAKGVPSNIIAAQGKGKTEPVTGNKCDGLKGENLKTCLAPDRRVEIQVKALNVKQVTTEVTK